MFEKAKAKVLKVQMQGICQELKSSISDECFEMYEKKQADLTDEDIKHIKQSFADKIFERFVSDMSQAMGTFAASMRALLEDPEMCGKKIDLENKNGGDIFAMVFYVFTGKKAKQEDISEMKDFLDDVFTKEIDKVFED